MNRVDIVRASKQTMPMKNASQYNPLEFQCNPEIDAFKQSFREDADFREMFMTAFADDSDGITIEELREVVAKSTNP